VCRRNEGERRHDYLARQLAGKNRDLQAYSCVAHSNAVSSGRLFGNASLEFLNEWSVVGDAPRFENPDHTAQQTA
jgi:hypothetical protein